MSSRTNAFKLRTPLSPVFSISWLTAASAAISAGDPVGVVDATGASTGVAKILATTGPTTADGRRFAGIAKSDSTDTGAAAGVVQVWLPLPGVIYSGKATSSAAADTAAEIAALVGKRVTLDLTSTTWSVLTSATDAAANGIVIVGGDYRSYEIYFTVAPGVTFLANNYH